MKVKNFAPGPSKIPKDILDEISQDVLDFRNLGQSVLELSHRGEVFENILNESKKNLHKIDFGLRFGPPKPSKIDTTSKKNEKNGVQKNTPKKQLCKTPGILISIRFE